VNTRPDPRIHFEPEVALQVHTSTPRSWLPLSAQVPVAVEHSTWLTRSARGISWHRFGRAPARKLAR